MKDAVSEICHQEDRIHVFWNKKIMCHVLDIFSSIARSANIEIMLTLHRKDIGWQVSQARGHL